MEIYLPYTTLEEKKGLIDGNMDKTFLRDERLSGKNFLVFDDGIEPPFDFPTELLKAYALVNLDEVNILRSEMTDLKVRVAALDSGDSTALNPRTVDRLKAAVKARMV